MADQPRTLAGRYRLLSVLGHGGMGQVWLAEDEVLGRRVAVKEIRFPTDLPVEQRAVLRERTLREARLTARLSHPGIITVYDVVSEHGSPYIVMELVTAPSLAAAIDMEGSLPPRRVAQIGLRLLDALDVAHSAGIVHRDVKPSNILLDGDRVILSDFGIATSSSDATLTTTGMVVGSPTYMSPERLRTEGVGPSGDMWSLGATLYAALEGHPPFRARNVMGTITAVLADTPEPPSVRGPLCDAVLGLLEKSPEQRLGSVRLRRLLERALSESPTGFDDPHLSSDLPVMAPATEAPAEETSVVEIPAAGAPVPGTPGTGTPGTGTPGSGTPGSGTSGTGRSGTGISATGTPGTDTPGTDTPSTTGTAAVDVPADKVPGPGKTPVVGGWHDHPARPPTRAGTERTPHGSTPEYPSAPPGEQVQPPRRPGRRTFMAALILAALVVAAVLAAAVVIARSNDGGAAPSDDVGSANGGSADGESGNGGSANGGDGTGPASGTGGGAGAEQNGPTGTASAPAGYRLVRDPLDFTVAVPRGWERRLDGPTRVDYVSPDGSRFLRVDQIAQAGPDAEQAWLDAEPSVAESLSGYSRIRIEPVDYRGWEAADWEFTWSSGSGTVHVLNRGFITDPRGFALYMSGPDDSWVEDSLPVFEVAADTFEPSS